MALPTPKPGLFGGIKARLGFGKGGYAEEIDRSGWSFSEATTTAALSGDGINQARSRQLIYQKWQQMMAAPLVSGSLRTHVTAALGGSETTGKLVFIEATPDAKKDPKLAEFVATLARELETIFNREAFQMAYLGAGFGDAYARIYSKPKVGIVQLRTDAMLFTPLCIPYEMGGVTRAVQVAVGSKYHERLEMNQIARLKMPRMIYTPQPLAQDMAMRVDLKEDDIDKLQMMPGLVGGSFLADAESAFDNFMAALLGLIGQRQMDAFDESIILANVTGMTSEQRQTFLNSVTTMLRKGKAMLAESIKLGKPILERVRHIIPINSEKQVMTVQAVNGGGGSGQGRAGNITIDDVLFHAKLLGGALGTDISMLGFADLISGGLGDGGFFRTSAQAAERSRAIRTALTDFFNHLIDVHLWARDGKTFAESERPWTINFYGNISALESERTKTRLDKVNTTTMMLQAFQLAKESGLDEAGLADLFESEMGIDADRAKNFAAAIIKAKKDQEKREAQQGGFGGVDDGDGGGGGGSPFGGGQDDPGDGSGNPGDNEDSDPPAAGAPKPVKSGGA